MEKNKDNKDNKSRNASVDKKKNIKKEKATGSDKAKKAPNGYILFGSELREEIKKQNPDFKAKDILRELGNRWKALNEDEKKKWNDKSKAMNDQIKLDNDEKDSANRKTSKPEGAKDIKEAKKGNTKKGK